MAQANLTDIGEQVDFTAFSFAGKNAIPLSTHNPRRFQAPYPTRSNGNKILQEDTKRGFTIIPYGSLLHYNLNHLLISRSDVAPDSRL